MGHYGRFGEAFGSQESRNLLVPDAAAGSGSAHPSPDVAIRRRFGNLAPPQTGRREAAAGLRVSVLSPGRPVACGTPTQRLYATAFPRRLALPNLAISH